MRARRTALPWLVAAIAIASADGAFAQKLLSLMPNEVVIELSNTASKQQVNALQRRLRLTRIGSQTFSCPIRHSIAGGSRTVARLPASCARWKAAAL